jgi:hypothetical protein
VIDYEERIDEVMLALNSEYAIGDRQCVELLLASAIPCNLPYPWIILETSYYQLDPIGAWFTSVAGKCLTLPTLRCVRPRTANQEVVDILQERNMARLFIEPFWEMPLNIKHNFEMWPYLTQECLRIRTRHPKTKLTDLRAELSLRAAAGKVWDCRFRTVQPKMPVPPISLPYFAEILQRLSPDVRSWESLLANLCSLAGRRAYLFNRDVDSTDWDAISRVMNDNIPVWVGILLSHLLEGKRLWQLRGRYTAEALRREMKRLAIDGVLFANHGLWYVHSRDDIKAGVVEMLNGLTFQ